MRRSFLRLLDVSPQDYRARFEFWTRCRSMVGVVRLGAYLWFPALAQRTRDAPVLGRGSESLT